MKKETTPTRNGHNMFEISSLIQKAIRRCDRIAYVAANELIPHYRNYLWKRLLTVSAEDCYDMITHRIVELHDLDSRANPSERKYIAIAVSTLLNARKNRDADYIACNILNSRDFVSLEKYIGKETFDNSCATKNGHSMFDLSKCFPEALANGDDVMAGYILNELLVYYRNYAWTLLRSEARRLDYADLIIEIEALCEADKIAGKQSTIFFSKSLALLLKVVKYKTTSIFSTKFGFNNTIDLSAYDRTHITIPEYVYDCHTYIGKRRGRTKQQFVVAEQRALTPHIEGEYDNASWEHFFWLCDNGFWIDQYTPRPPKERLKELDNLSIEPSLFD